MLTVDKQKMTAVSCNLLIFVTLEIMYIKFGAEIHSTLCYR